MNKLNSNTLKQLQGLNARLWDFSPSHDSLTYRISNNEEGSDQYLIFAVCDAIDTSIVWNITNPKIREEKDFIVVEDKNFKILCAEVYLESGYTLKYFNEKYGGNDI